MSGFVQQIVGLPTPFNMVVLIVLFVIGGSLCGEIARQIRRFACHRQELDFKRELIDRGLSAQEIELIVRAHNPATAPSTK
jgi:hypothetical protein